MLQMITFTMIVITVKCMQFFVCILNGKAKFCISTPIGMKGTRKLNRASGLCQLFIYTLAKTDADELSGKGCVSILSSLYKTCCNLPPELVKSALCPQI